MKRAKEKGAAPLSVWKNNLFMLKLMFQASPVYLILLIFETVKNRILIFIEHTWGIQFLLESAEFGRPFRNVAVYLVGFTFVMLLNMIWSTFYVNYFVPKGKELANQRLKLRLYQKAAEIDLSCYDTPTYYNEFVLAVAEAEQCIDRTAANLEQLCNGLTLLVTTGVFTLRNDAVSGLFVLASFLLNFVFSQKLNALIYRVRLKINPLERKRDYIHRVFYLPDYAKELRLYPRIGQKLEQRFSQANEEIERTHRNCGKKRTGLHFMAYYFSGSFLLDVCYFIYLVYQAAVCHTISYSNVIVLWNAVYGFRRGIQRLAELLPKLSENSLYTQKLQDFMVYEPKIKSEKGLPVPDRLETLEFRDVSFSYGDHCVLNKINLTIHDGEQIALVGFNGAGKTTLIKLLMRLYDPTEGHILWNGTDIREFDPVSYREKIGAVFQDYNIYGATVEENVTMDVLAGDSKRMQTALEQSGFSERLLQLPQGLLTPLTTELEEGGVNLSGGEAQRLAIARVFYRNASLIILDEPSAALDPLAEYRMNLAMSSAARGKTVIYISHRLSTTRHAHRIYMLEQGRIAEEGTHSQLLMKEGKYAKMWYVQAEPYRDK